MEALDEKELLRNTSYSDVYKALCEMRTAINRDPPKTESVRARFLRRAQTFVFLYNASPPEWKRENPFDTQGLLRKLSSTEEQDNLLARRY